MGALRHGRAPPPTAAVQGTIQPRQDRRAKQAHWDALPPKTGAQGPQRSPVEAGPRGPQKPP